MKFFTFPYFYGSFLPSWIRIQQLKLMRIHNPGFGNIYNIYFSKHSAQRHEKDVHSFYRTLGANRFVCRYRDCAAAFDNIDISVSASTVRNATRRMCTASTARWAPTSSSAAIGIAPPPLTRRRISACTARPSTRQSSGSVFWSLVLFSLLKSVQKCSLINAIYKVNWSYWALGSESETIFF